MGIAKIHCVLLLLALSTLIGITNAQAGSAAKQTFCNPLNLPYRFELAPPSYREAADPTVVYYHNYWWLFASKCGGYFRTADFKTFLLIQPTGLPLEDYAPTSEVIKGKLYFCAGGHAIYTTDDPTAGAWTKVCDLHDAPDVDLFADTDGKVYLYYGCSNQIPIYGEELDPDHSFQTIGTPVPLISSDRANHGWELRKEPAATLGSPEEDAKNGNLAPWVEGSWMNKVGGRYYLQYASPGTELDGYADGAYVGDHPLGPFTYMPSNPFSYKPTGFARGAGHGSTFKDAKGNYWHIATVTIAKRHVFERRLAMYPVKFFDDGQAACNTYLGDYPQFLPGTSNHPFMSNSPGWMLLSLNKSVTVSSTLPGCPASNAVDESIQDWWSASIGNPSGWLQVDLGTMSTIRAVQIDFADVGSTTLGRLTGDAYRYVVEASADGLRWHNIVDRSDNQADAPQDYEQLKAPVRGRYVRILNIHTPGESMFSVSGLRVFGNAEESAPQRAQNISATRDMSDRRSATITWRKAKGAEFYVVRYGVRPDRLYSNYQVYGATSLDLHSLNAQSDYCVTVDSVNTNGVTRGPRPIAIK
jgi:xylan 1,4-beta-xylosidase